MPLPQVMGTFGKSWHVTMPLLLLLLLLLLLELQVQGPKTLLPRHFCTPISIPVHEQGHVELGTHWREGSGTSLAQACRAMADNAQMKQGPANFLKIANMMSLPERMRSLTDDTWPLIMSRWSSSAEGSSLQLNPNNPSSASP